MPAYSTLSLVVSLVNMALKNHSKRAGWDCKVHALVQVIKSYNKQQSWPGGPEHLRSAMKLLRDAVVIRGGYHDMSNIRNLAKYMENIATVNDRPLGAPKKDRATVIKGEQNVVHVIHALVGEHPHAHCVNEGHRLEGIEGQVHGERPPVVGGGVGGLHVGDGAALVGGVVDGHVVVPGLHQGLQIRVRGTRGDLLGQVEQLVLERHVRIARHLCDDPPDLARAYHGR